MEAGHLPGHRPAAYARMPTDGVRHGLETPWLARLAGGLVDSTGGRRVLDLGCGGGLGPELGSVDYTGVDFRAPRFELPGPYVLHDLRDGLGPVGQRPFDLYLAGFGLASHLTPDQLKTLLGQIATHGQSGSLVAIEALGLYSLEWPRLWSRPVGPARTLPYQLNEEVAVHPWGPGELARLMEDAGMRVLALHDRTVQAGPKTSEGGYWPGLPDLRASLAGLLADRPPAAALSAPLPPLPAGAAAALHQNLATSRRAAVAAHRGSGVGLAHRIWALEQGSGGGFGHGLMAVARLP